MEAGFCHYASLTARLSIRYGIITSTSLPLIRCQISGTNRWKSSVGTWPRPLQRTLLSRAEWWPGHPDGAYSAPLEVLSRRRCHGHWKEGNVKTAIILRYLENFKKYSITLETIFR